MARLNNPFCNADGTTLDGNLIRPEFSEYEEESAETTESRVCPSCGRIKRGERRLYAESLCVKCEKVTNQ